MKRFSLAFIMVISCVSLFAQANMLTMAVGPGHSQALRDFFVKVYRDAGFELTLVEYPAARQNYVIDSGSADCLLFAAESVFQAGLITKGLKIGFGNNPLFSFPTQGFVLAARKADFERRTGNSGLKIGFVQGTRGQEDAIKAWGSTPEGVTSIDGGVQMLDKGRIDLLLAVAGAVDSALQQHNLVGKVVMLDKPMIEANYFHVLSDKHRDKLPKIQASLLKYKAELDTLVYGRP